MYPRKFFTCVILAVSLVTLFSCHKAANDNGYRYNIENFTDKPLNVNIYKTLNDYNNNTNVYLSGKMDVRGYLSLPLNDFVKGQTYYIDWYSDDFLYNNWFWTNITVRNSIKPSNDDYEFMIDGAQFSDPSRLIWMNGFGPLTTWKAVNSFNISGNTYTSTWSQLNSFQHNTKLVLQKDFSAHLYMQVSADSTTDSLISYHANYDSVANVSNLTFYNNDGSSFGNAKSNFAPATYTFNGDRNTILAYFNNIGYLELVRQ